MRIAKYCIRCDTEPASSLNRTYVSANKTTADVCLISFSFCKNSTKKIKGLDKLRNRQMIIDRILCKRKPSNYFREIPINFY